MKKDFLRQRKKLAAITDVPRLQNSFALLMVAGRLAQEWDILPKKWGRVGPHILDVAEDSLRTTVAESRAAHEIIRSYILANRRHFVRLGDKPPHFDEVKFDAAAGFIREAEGVTQLLVSTKHLHREIANCRQVMAELRDRNLAKTEKGVHPKLSIKAPTDICKKGRAYCICLRNELGNLKL